MRPFFTVQIQNCIAALLPWTAVAALKVTACRLLGKSARIEIIHKLGETQQGGKRLYANINGVSVLPSTMKAPTLTSSFFITAVLTPDNAAYERLNRKHKAIIQRSNGVQAPAQAA